jgi:TfoX/Sxy family transcriptional regulator of competence genes
MAYDEELADRARAALGDRDDLSERKMFGGLALMVGGNMCVGVTGDDLMLRLGVDGADTALDEDHTRPMDFTGRPLKGFIYVSPAGTASDADLQRWVDRALAFVETLPPKA